jgi:hypothetical protein
MSLFPNDSFRNVRVNEYKTPNGKYQVTITPSVTVFGPYFEMGGKSIWDNLPRVRATLARDGFINDSRDLYLKGLDFTLAFDDKSTANKVARVYKAIVKAHQLDELK